VIGCKAVWRPDGLELVAVQADDCGNLSTGELVRFTVTNPGKQRSLQLQGDNPTFQPLTIR
jgi:hypothetical protein